MEVHQLIRSGSFGLYAWIMLFGLIFGGWLWSRRWKTQPHLFGIYVGGMCGALLGAKVLYLISEGYLHFSDENWIFYVASGKTIVGALLGGYVGVELAKKLLGHREATGDWFAVIVPAGIATGRVGCLRYGCCLGESCDPDAWYALVDRTGIARWPAVPLELGFNLLFLIVMLPIRKAGVGKGQLFHAYLVSYGAFRLWHGFHRNTPDLILGLSGYQLGSIALILLGGVMGYLRSREKKKMVGQPVTAQDV